ncbi:MAG TPA: restriction endonuclease subunit S, partial [Polyangiaceae bacterium]|nr:restriction endonuclease subunit S [Polyangiaceae bacterium]
HIESGSGRLLDYTTVAKDGVTSGKHLFHAGHILYSKIRPYLAKVVVVDFAGLCSADMYPVSTDLETRFLHRWLVSPMFTEQAAHNQGRTVLPKINQDALARLPVPVAPLSEQRRIVAKLEALQARSRRAREALDAVPPLLEKLRQSILAAAFRGDLTKDWRAKHKDAEPASKLLERIRAERRKKWEETELAKLTAKGKTPKGDEWKAKYKEPEPVDAKGLPELPEAWCWATAQDICHDITVGHVGPMESRYVPTGVPFLRSQNVRANRFDPAELRFIPPDFHAELSKSKLRPGDLVIVRSGAPGTACVIPDELDDANCADLVVARLVSLVDPHVMAFYMNSMWARDAVLDAQVGVAQQHFNVGSMRRLHMPLMPQLEQQLLRARLTDALAAVDAQLSRIGELEQRQAHLQQSVLAKAFRGELVPQDPNDEPAEVMLARVRAANTVTTNGALSKRRKKSASAKERSTAAESHVDDNDGGPALVEEG